MISKTKIIEIISVTVIFVMLCSLGTWQVKRLYWKKNLLKTINYNQTQHPVELTPDIINNYYNYIYKKVYINGYFLHEKEFYLYAGGRSNELGYFILTPLLSNNYSILINRGRVPLDKKEKIKRSETLIKDKVRVEGIIMPAEQQTTFIPNNNYSKNEWFWIDIQQIGNITQLNLPNFYIIQQSTDANSVIKPNLFFINLPNNHLQYAITWYSSAFVLLLIYYLFLKKRKLIKSDK